MESTLEQLAALTGATLHGDGATRVSGVSGIQHARAGEIALLAGGRFKKYLATTRAAALVVGRDFDPSETELPFLAADDPSAAFESIAAHFGPEPPTYVPSVHPTAVIDEAAHVDPTASIGACCVVEAGAVIGPNTVIRPLVFVGRDARIGSGCLLYPQCVVLDRCRVGDRAIIHSGVVIGADGYGFEMRDGVHVKLPQRGVVEIGNDVEIGANTTVDRARYGRTVIGSGTKIDNLVQVAHNVVTGEHCLLVAQAGIAGSVTLGHHVIIAAQAGLVGHITLGDGSIVGAKAGVPGDLEPGSRVLGAPAQDLRRERRSMILHQKLPELAERIRSLEQAVDALTQKRNGVESEADDNPETG